MVSRSSLRPWPSTMRCTIFSIQPVDSRHGVPCPDVSYTPGFFTRPETEYIRVPPCVLVPSPANHAAPRSMIGGTQQSVSTLLTIVGWPKAPLMAGNGGLILGQPFLPSSDESRPVSSPQM